MVLNIDRPIFDLLFIAAFFASIVTLVIAAAAAVRGQRERAMSILRRYAISAAAYFGMGAIVSLLSPRHVLNVGDRECNDDWCIAVEHVSRTPAPSAVYYRVTLQLSSRARRVAQRENGVTVYLTGDRGARYDPVPDSSAIPFNVLLQPQDSVAITRAFQIPPDARDVDLVVDHDSRYNIGWFIVGEAPLHKPTLVRLQ